jgi:5-methylcytosine-specific restriction endonuclease McrA
MSYLQSPCLVLNKSWRPMMVKPVRSVLTSAVKGESLIMDPTDYNLYDFMSWVQKDIHPETGESMLGPEDKVIQCVRFQVRVPEIVISTDYNDVPDLELKWNRRNLALRDNNECQYCGKKVYGEDASIDHVVPRSRGGKNTWANTVIACKPCNRRKRNRTPEEAGLVLRNKPVKPRWYPLTARFSTKMPASWAKWVPDWEDHPLASMSR